MATHKKHPGAAGKVLIETVHADPGGSPPVVAVQTDMCVMKLTASVTRKTVGSTTTCNWDDDDETLYEEETVISRRLDFSFTCFSADEVDDAAILQADTLGPFEFKRHGSKSITFDEGIIKKVDYDWNGVDGLQQYIVSGSCTTKFVIT